MRIYTEFHFFQVLLLIQTERTHQDAGDGLGYFQDQMNTGLAGVKEWKCPLPNGEFSPLRIPYGQSWVFYAKDCGEENWAFYFNVHKRVGR